MLEQLTDHERALVRDALATHLQELANGDAAAYTERLEEAGLATLAGEDREAAEEAEEYGEKALQRAIYGALEPIFAKLFPGDDPWRQ